MASHGPATHSGPAAAPPDIVVIGTSAGGLNALTGVLETLPADLPAPVIVVQHLSPTFESRLAEILGQRTRLTVEQARPGIKLQNAHVYIAPPDHHLTVDRFERLRLDDSAPVHFSRPAVDRLFSSAAAAFGERVLAIVLSGSGTDGSAGVRAVHARGGTVIAQDETTSEHFGMPRAAISTGSVDYVLPLSAIAEHIVELLHKNERQETREFEALLDLLKRSRGFDFTGYKRTTLMRRIRRRMADIRVDNYADYGDRLETDPTEYQQLFNTILINVTSFFRDPEAWEALRMRVIEPLAARDEPLRAWSAGCASGEETYTLVMLLVEAMGADRFKQSVKIYATDADDEALEHARNAHYSTKSIEAVAEPLRAKYFEYNRNGWTFRNDLRRYIIFGRHDLVTDAPISRLDLLVCRNTLIYFNSETQSRILARFHFGLDPDGFVFLGRSEMLVTHARLFAPVDMDARIFRKLPASDLRDRLMLAPRARTRRDEIDIQAMPVPDLTLQQIHMRDVSFESAPLAQIILDRAGNIILSNQQARRLFHLDSADIGRPVPDLELSYRPVEIRSHIDQAVQNRTTVAIRGVEYRDSAGELTFFDVQIEPLLDVDRELLGVSITYVDVSAGHHLRIEVARSQHELETAYDELQATNEELETTNEELQSSVEELETTNEELQSTNEELETLNEELHSTNDELESINEELRRRSQELNYLNDFMGAIMTSMKQAVVVIDTDMHVQLWNQKAEELWGLRAHEVQGKVLTNLDIGLRFDKLNDQLRGCLTGKPPFDVQFIPAVNRRGKNIQVRLSCNILNTYGNANRGLLILVEEVA